MHRLSSAFNARARNAYFGGAVFSVDGAMGIEGPPAPEIPIQTQPAPEAPVVQEVTSLRNLVLNVLTATSPATQDLQDQKLKLIADASVGSIDLAATDEFVLVCREEKQTNWQREHIEVRRLGREQLATCERLTVEFNICNQRWNGTSQAKIRALDDIKAARYQQAHLGRFSSDSEIKAAEAAVGNAQVRGAKAVEADARAMAARNQAENALSDARAELNRLGAAEHQLRCLIEGKAYVDPEYGLVTAGA